MFIPHYVSGVRCQVSPVTCPMSKKKMVELAGGGSVINGAYPIYFILRQKQIISSAIPASLSDSGPAVLACHKGTKALTPADLLGLDLGDMQGLCHSSPFARESPGSGSSTPKPLHISPQWCSGSVRCKFRLLRWRRRSSRAPGQGSR